MTDNGGESGSVRTEPDAEARVVRMTMGGVQYRVPTLAIGQSEEWQDALGLQMSRMQVGDATVADADAVIGTLLKQGWKARLDAVIRYDVTGVLGGAENIAAKMDQRELYAASEAVLDAEFPFDMEARRSVVVVYGLPLKALGQMSEDIVDELSRTARSASGRLPIGDSTTPPSASDGPPNNSPSAGRTGRSGSKSRPKPTG